MIELQKVLSNDNYRDDFNSVSFTIESMINLYCMYCKAIPNDGLKSNINYKKDRICLQCYLNLEINKVFIGKK